MSKKIVGFLRTYEGVFLSLITVVAGFLRLYRFNDFVTFLGDQGRDAIIIKRILTFEHFPAIGPPTSVGQVYLGPFYYYFMAPWLYLSNFEPIGLAIGVAVLSTAFIIVSYFMIKDLFNQKVAIISSIFMTFSSTLIEFSRLSWNPNLLPFFTLFTIYFTIKASQKFSPVHFLLAGAFLSFSIQLHYLALLLIPPIVLFYLIKLFQDKKVREFFRGGLLMLSSFLFFSMPLIIFDLRHNFLNSKNFAVLFKGSQNVSTKNLETITGSFSFLNQYLFNTKFSNTFIILILILFFLLLLSQLKNRTSLRAILLFFLILLLGVSLYVGPKYPHYLGILYIPYIILLSYLLSFLAVNFIGRGLLVLFILGFVLLNGQNYYFLKNRGNFQIDRAKKISKIIFDDIKVKKYKQPKKFWCYTFNSV